MLYQKLIKKYDEELSGVKLSDIGSVQAKVNRMWAIEYAIKLNQGTVTLHNRILETKPIHDFRLTKKGMDRLLELEAIIANKK